MLTLLAAPNMEVFLHAQAQTKIARKRTKKSAATKGSDEQLQAALDNVNALNEALAAQEVINDGYKYFSKQSFRMKSDIPFLINKYRGKDEVCIDDDNKDCYDAALFFKGGLKAWVFYSMSKDKGQSDSDVEQVMMAGMPLIKNMIEEYGYNPADSATLVQYFTRLIKKTEDYCNNDFHLVNVAPGVDKTFGGQSKGIKAKADKEDKRRENQCTNIGSAMIMLGIVTPSGQKNASADILGKALRDNYDADYGLIIMQSALGGLIALGVKYSYSEYITNFIFTDLMPNSTAWKQFQTGFMQIVSLIDAENLAEKGISAGNAIRGGGGRYLNGTAEKYQYVDYETARAMGVSDFSTRLPAFAYKVPYANSLEDIGILISTTGTKEGNDIAASIVSKYVRAEEARTSCLKLKGKDAVDKFIYSGECDASKTVNLPLVVGVLRGSTVITEDMKKAAKYINSLDWWDLNEGTQRRINNLPTTNKAFGALTVKTEDNDKLRRSSANAKIKDLGMWVNMLDLALGSVAIVAALPSIVRSAVKFSGNVRRIRAISNAGKKGLYKSVKAEIRASKEASASTGKVASKIDNIKGSINNPVQTGKSTAKGAGSADDIAKTGGKNNINVGQTHAAEKDGWTKLDSKSAVADAPKFEKIKPADIEVKLADNQPKLTTDALPLKTSEAPQKSWWDRQKDGLAEWLEGKYTKQFVDGGSGKVVPSADPATNKAMSDINDFVNTNRKLPDSNSDLFAKMQDLRKNPANKQKIDDLLVKQMEDIDGQIKALDNFETATLKEYDLIKKGEISSADNGKHLKELEETQSWIKETQSDLLKQQNTIKKTFGIDPPKDIKPVDKNSFAGKLSDNINTSPAAKTNVESNIMGRFKYGQAEQKATERIMKEKGFNSEVYVQNEHYYENIAKSVSENSLVRGVTLNSYDELDNILKTGFRQEKTGSKLLKGDELGIYVAGSDAESLGVVTYNTDLSFWEAVRHDTGPKMKVIFEMSPDGLNVRKSVSRRIASPDLVKGNIPPENIKQVWVWTPDGKWTPLKDIIKSQ